MRSAHVSDYPASRSPAGPKTVGSLAELAAQSGVRSWFCWPGAGEPGVAEEAEGAVRARGPELTLDVDALRGRRRVGQETAIWPPLV